MATTKAQQKAVNKYVKANYDRIEYKAPEGRKAEIKAHAEERGESVNGFINRAIDETRERDKPNSNATDDVAPSRDLAARAAARAEYESGETVSHEAINWD